MKRRSKRSKPRSPHPWQYDRETGVHTLANGNRSAVIEKPFKEIFIFVITVREGERVGELIAVTFGHARRLAEKFLTDGEFGIAKPVGHSKRAFATALSRSESRTVPCVRKV